VEHIETGTAHGLSQSMLELLSIYSTTSVLYKYSTFLHGICVEEDVKTIKMRRAARHDGVGHQAQQQQKAGRPLKRLGVSAPRNEDVFANIFLQVFFYKSKISLLQILLFIHQKEKY
jgi:hypothetical protein